ncbi:glycoside hydrolase family 113 [Aequorivita xiaoshiensis]|uniref:Glycoside hydrolase n=1 Tax=Aequorivita xiaoshiensis TaxID=2874476 RepID=A0A9X1R5D1_9FLAO|nr:glycoside hydrolase [Aequorivita xiaoshiensis]MCG2432037.1 glycoside hydrolase [Aequorivita xiaoshiensis]
MIKKYTFLLYILLFTYFVSCEQKNDLANHEESNGDIKLKINGVSFVSSNDSVNQENIEPILRIGANYAAIMPFGFIKNVEHPELIYNSERQWFGETIIGAEQYVNTLQKNDFKVMIKPQIWVWRGEFTGGIKMNSEEDWLSLENSYKNFILDYARLAERKDVEIFCIGTELENFIIHRPAYWRKLVSEVRTVYSGELTYAANWDEYKRVPFWDVLDFIGVDAYFPVSNSQTPTVSEIKSGFEKWQIELKTFSEEKGKKILFTEYGYRSVDYSGKEPWRSDKSMNSVNLQAQSNLLEGLYQSIWDENWFAGGFLWKWFIAYDKVGGENDSQFTPQNKSAEAVVKKYYSK